MPYDIRYIEKMVFSLRMQLRDIFTSKSYFLNSVREYLKDI